MYLIGAFHGNIHFADAINETPTEIKFFLFINTFEKLRRKI